MIMVVLVVIVIAMLVSMRMIVTVKMIVGMAIVMMIVLARVIAIVAVLMAVLLICGRFIHEDVDLGRGDAAAIDAADAELSADVERSCRSLEDIFADAGVEERAQHHVSTDSGKAFEISNTHRCSETYFLMQRAWA